MSLSGHRIHRAFRKAIRPLRQALFRRPLLSDSSPFHGPVLILLAHPDDEVFCSGLICDLRERDIPVHLLLFTKGEGGERGNLPTNVDLGEERAKEMQTAASHLQASSLTFLDYQDPAMGPKGLVAPDHESAELIAEISAQISKHKIAHLVTHGSNGEYWHPAHLCLHRHARKLLRKKKGPPLLWTFNAWHPKHPLPAVLNQDDAASLILDVSAHHDRRLASLSSHSSQASVFERFAKGTLSDFITKTSPESYHRW